MAVTAVALAAATVAGALLPTVSAAQEASAPAAESPWRLAVGLGLAVDGGGSQHDPEPLGLGTHASVTRRLASGLRVGLQWDGAWFDAKLTTEKRLQLSAVLEVDVPDTPLRARIGPGLGLASVVDVELPPPGQFGDAQVSVGDRYAWGFVAGLGARVRLGRSVVLEPMADLLYQRADGFHGGTFEPLTLVFGSRLGLRP